MAEVAESLYTLGRWLVKSGQEDAFVVAWAGAEQDPF